MIYKKLNSIDKSLLLTPREIEVINKKLSRAKLTQQDSNYLSRFVRPKLIEMKSMDAKDLLEKLNHNQKSLSIEKKIINLILKEFKSVDSITLYGSAIQNNFKDYNDIDVLVIVRKKFWDRLSEKYKEILEIKRFMKKYSINLDLQVYDKKTFKDSYKSNISLVYQLENMKTIYGSLKLPKKVEIPKLELRMKLDYSIIDDKSKGIEIYRAIRNIILIDLILNKIINNKKLINTLNEELGKNLAERLKLNKESNIDRKIAFLYLKNLLNLILNRLKKEKWEKIVLLNH